MIAIVDYGMGNLKSVQKALTFLNIDSFISSKKDEISRSKGIIIPGVGAFPDAMENIKKDGLDLLIKEEAKKGKPILGICLGMQLLFEESEEICNTKGLGFLKGKVVEIQGDVKVPHMGWNNLKFQEESLLLKGVKEGSFAYFVHSYYAKLGEEGILNAYTEYGVSIPAIVSKDNIFGIQFHPEKSGEAGMKILKNFGELII
ncbi:MAG: imidazole glycerol phosphate synthase subunit HisH [Clostridium lundense]|nr:imidazole glycerol phosphate synthase subunit HisH [Clostridium lundense]